MKHKTLIICAAVAAVCFAAPAFRGAAGPGWSAGGSVLAQTGDAAVQEEKKKREEKERIDDLCADIISGDEEDSEKALKSFKEYPVAEKLSQWLALLEKAKLPRIKREIIELVGSLRDKNCVVPLAKELSSPYSEVRKSAALALKDYYDDRIYPFILALSTSTNPVLRIYFIEAMNHLYDRRFYEMLINLLKDPNKSVRIYSINCLSSNNLTDSIPLIRNIALGDGNDEVKVNALDALGHFVDKGSLYVLLKTLNDPNRDVRFTTAKTLHRFSMGNSAVPLSQRLSVETDDGVKGMIIDALIKIRNAGNIGGLSRVLLTDGNEDLRVKSAYAMGVIKDVRAIPLLLQGMSDSSYKVRAESANSLGMYKTPDSIRKLVATVENDPEIYVRSAALYSLKRITDRKTAMPLFDIYAREKDVLFRELLRTTIRDFMNRYL